MVLISCVNLRSSAILGAPIAATQGSEDDQGGRYAWLGVIAAHKTNHYTGPTCRRGFTANPSAASAMNARGAPDGVVGSCISSASSASDRAADQLDKSTSWVCYGGPAQHRGHVGRNSSVYSMPGQEAARTTAADRRSYSADSEIRFSPFGTDGERHVIRVKDTPYHSERLEKGR